MVSETLPKMSSNGWSRARILNLRTGLFISKIGQGLYTVCIAWSAFAVGGTIASVGLVLVWWSLITLIAGPFLGVISDNIDQRIMHAAARFVEIILFLVVAALMHSGVSSITLLILTACIASFAALMVNPCLHVFIKQGTNEKEALKQSIIAMALMQAGLVAGTGCGGLILAKWGIAAGFVACAIASLLSWTFIVFSAPASMKSGGSQNTFLGDFVEGVTILRKDRQLRVLVAGLTFAVSIGQVTVSVLPAFISTTLNGNAATYGLIDATYSVGSLIASILVVLGLNKSEYRYFAPTGLTIMSFLLVTISFSSSTSLAIFLFFLLGFTYSVCRVSFDGAIQASTSHHAVGRIRNNTQSIIGLVGIIIYLVPSMITHNSPSFFYAGYGMLFLVLSIYAYRTIPTSLDEPSGILRCQFREKARLPATKIRRSRLIP